jgi:2-desacetyl-2-hydroxyethyl bacteriochlorophyllide A dehydrogenase
MPLRLEIPFARRVELVSYQEAPLQPHEVRAAAVLSGISHGTELNLYRGTSPFEDKAFDPDLRLFRPLTEAPSPLRLGYEWVGRVVEAGAEVGHLQPGDLVHMLLPHAETHTFDPLHVPYRRRVEALPPGLATDDAILLALAGVALVAVHDARIKLGDRVAVFGLGAIGLLAIQLAQLSGAAWIDAVDLLSQRRALALDYGADRALDPAACDVGLEIKSASLQRGADVAIEVSGAYPALHEAIRSVRPGGLVVAAGFYQGGAAGLRLGEEWHHNRITMLSSMAVWGNPHRSHPLWDRERVNDVVTELLAGGRLRTGGLITHRVPFRRAAEAYELIDKHPDQALKVVLTY